jgi:hypothetical protein
MRRQVMSNANPASNAIRATRLFAVPEAARQIAALVADAIASTVLRRAVRRAHRELAALDDGMLADIGLDRAAVDDLAAISRRETWMSLTQFPGRCPDAIA